MTTPQDVRRAYDEDEGFDSDEAPAPGADPNCRYCGGRGYVTDWVPRPFGPGNVPMHSTCECVDDDDDGQPSDLQEQQDFAGDDDPRDFMEAL